MAKSSFQSWRARPKNTMALFPAAYTVSYASTRACLKEYGLKLRSVIYMIKGADYEIVLETKEDYDKFGAMFVRRFQREPRYLTDLVRWSEARTNLLYEFIRNNFDVRTITRLSNLEIARRYGDYVKAYSAYCFKNIPAWWMGALAAEAELKEYLSAHYSFAHTDEILSVIIDPLEYPSENYNEETSLLIIATRIKSARIRTLSLKNLPPAIQADFLQHCSTYCSLPFGYCNGIVWDKAYFLDRLRVMVKGDPAARLAARRREIRRKTIRRDEIVAGLRLPQAMFNLVVAMRQLAYLQELKKTTQTRSHPILQLIVKPEIGRRVELAVKYLDYLDEREMASVLRAGRVSAAFRKELAWRDSLSVNIIAENRSHWLLGRHAAEFFKINGLMAEIEPTGEVRGIVACPGRARGPIRICPTAQEINKVKTGDILVTAMTTPDFVPAMRRAAAIVTDEGGITSHAAIVARELNKPCIIGTKFATKVFKDGDRVEVDADKGVIRKIVK